MEKLLPDRSVTRLNLSMHTREMMTATGAI